MKKLWYNFHFVFSHMIVWGQRIWVPWPILNNKPKGPAEEENIQGWLRKAQSY